MFKTLTTLSSFLFISSLENNNNQNNQNIQNNNNVDFNLPSIDFNDLLTMNKDTSKDLISYLTSIGGIQIINIPKFNEIKEKGLNKLSECLLSDTNKIETIMKDGKKRLTIGAPNYNGIPQEMESYCGTPAGDLRSTIDSTTRLLLNLLDKSIPINAQKQDLITPYQTFTELAANGDHLEHLHSYYSSNEFSKSDSSTFLENENQKILSSNKITYTMDLHTDSGLFIAMTNGYYKPLSSSTSSSSSSTSKLNNIHSNIQQNNGLYIQLSSGEIVRTYTDPDSLIFMIGQGASDWFSPIFGTKLRALPHALSADLSNGMTRSWYGKMYLPPSDALLPEYDGTRLSYSSYRVRELSASTFAAKSKDFKISEYLPSACGMMESSHKLLEMVQNTLCDNGNGVYCWQQCYPLSDYSCGAQAECIDTATGEPVDGTIMCPSAAGMGACEVQCPIAKNSSSNDFCWGAGTDMYMDGFTSIVQEEDGSTACLNLFFKEWTLNNKTKYGFACIGVFFLGVLVEFLTSFRKSLWKQLEKGHLRNIILMFLHCIQLCVGYFLMLAAMTYNVEIFCMVLAGVGVGHAIFNINEPPQGTDHCCAGANESLLDSKKSLH